MRTLISSIAIGLVVVAMSSCTIEHEITFNDDYSGHYQSYTEGGFGGKNNPFSQLMNSFGNDNSGSDDSLHVDKYITDDMPSPSDSNPFKGGFDSLLNDVAIQRLREIPGLSNLNYQMTDSTSGKMFITSFDFADVSALNAGISNTMDNEKLGGETGFEISKSGRKLGYRFKVPENSSEFDAFQSGEMDLGGMEAFLSMTSVKMKFTYPKKIKKVKTDAKYRLSNDDHTVSVKHSLEDLIDGNGGMTVKLRRF